MNRWQILSLLLMISLLVGCASNNSREDVVSNNDEFNRTTSCVNGELPVEIRSQLLGKPTRITRDALGTADVDALAEELDLSVASLLESSMRTAWSSAISRHKPWTREFIAELKIEYAAEIAAQAPKRMRLEFCGSHASVGNSVLAAISTYFSRSVTFENGQPKWLAEGARGDGTTIVMLAVGLRLARIEFDPDVLVLLSSYGAH